MGGVRDVLHYMQRTATQASPTTVGSIRNEWVSGAAQPTDPVHPFRKHFEELRIGETLTTHRRTVTEADIVNFAAISGDHFYAHVDDIAAKESIFGQRVAHGYFVLSAAAGLFVDPAPGPVLANYGLENLRFTKPVHAGDTIQAKLGSGIVNQLLADRATDRDIVAGLYLRTLTRQPSASEQTEWIRTLTAAGDRREAVEDLLWALLNSREFGFNH